MTDELVGVGEAGDAAISAEPVVAVSTEEIDLANAAVAGAQAKVAKQQAFLAATEAYLAQVTAERDALVGGSN